MQYSTAQVDKAQFSSLQYSTAQLCQVQFSRVQYTTAQIWYDDLLYVTIHQSVLKYRNICLLQYFARHLKPCLNFGQYVQNKNLQQQKMLKIPTGKNFSVSMVKSLYLCCLVSKVICSSAYYESSFKRWLTTYFLLLILYHIYP